VGSPYPLFGKKLVIAAQTSDREMRVLTVLTPVKKLEKNNSYIYLGSDYTAASCFSIREQPLFSANHNMKAVILKDLQN
jgi:hypothetical protein